MTPKERAAMKQALEALEGGLWDYGPGQDEHDKCNEVITALREALESDVEDKDTAYMLGFSDGKQYAHKHEQHVQEGKCSDHPDAPHGFDRNASHNADRYVCECESWSHDDMAYRPGGLSMMQTDREALKNLVRDMRIDVELKQKVYAALAEQAEQEPVIKYPGCNYCNDELFCGRKCKCCGKVFIEDEDFVQSEVKELRQQVAALKAVIDAWNNVEQEPVAWVDLEQWQSGEYDCFTSEKVADYMTPLYATPVRTKDLTDDEIAEIMKQPFNQTKYLEQFARAVIAADRKKNK